MVFTTNDKSKICNMARSGVRIRIRHLFVISHKEDDFLLRTKIIKIKIWVIKKIVHICFFKKKCYVITIPSLHHSTYEILRNGWRSDFQEGQIPILYFWRLWWAQEHPLLLEDMRNTDPASLDPLLLEVMKNKEPTSLENPLLLRVMENKEPL